MTGRALEKEMLIQGLVAIFGKEEEVRKMQAKQIVSLCPACDACPAVEVYEETVRIGEGNNEVVLAKAEWNALIEAILQKNLTKL
jgi:hypothetical protein